MLSPEIWNFKPPKHNFSTLLGTKELSSKVSSEISKHHFNHSVTVVLPDTVLVPKAINSTLINDCIYYKVVGFSVHKLLDKQFIESFINKGELTALSVGTCIDTDDCAAIIPSGHLVLNLTKETFQSLGLEGSQSAFSTERYVVKIDLKNPSFTPGKKNYERALKCLSEFAPLQMDFIIAWEPPEAPQKQQVCPSSIAAYLSTCGEQVSECTPKLTTSRQYNVKLPSLANVELPDLLEWLGAVSHGVDMNREDAEGHYLSTYRGPLETQGESQVAVLTFRGLFTTRQIDNFYCVLRSYIEERTDALWAAMHVQGFADAPVSWGLQEHTFHSDGNNDYTIIHNSDGAYQLIKCSVAPAKLKHKVQ
ncbi:ribonuclease P protein subunit p40-like isoform X3 [Macrosteles quadrilineatus]|uniref:ribonuclease P protein subunit p40-like isoform X3 n=1 Tax=Macrosteles quadrilineatus TaxID=74068 RepID=UPI0023E140CF|nr:ribonuclease P protein subunit p40-like isoform X3 [Macrosteles quadrilineatus]